MLLYNKNHLLSFGSLDKSRVLTIGIALDEKTGAESKNINSI